MIADRGVVIVHSRFAELTRLRRKGEGLLELGETAVIVKKADGKIRVSPDLNVVEKDPRILEWDMPAELEEAFDEAIATHRAPSVAR
jgi:hypothetical protein